MSCITRPLINVKIKYENAKMKLKLFQRCNNNFYTTYEKYHYTLAILNRKPPCHPQPKAKRFGLGIHIPFCHPALDAGSIRTGFPFSRE